jgi:tetratricopeptide (TPR) repeat protein
LAALQESLNITEGTDGSINARILRARANLDLGKPLESIYDLDQVIEINSGNGRAYASRALAYAILEQYVQASEDAARAVELGIDGAAMDRALEEIKQKR